MTGGHYSHNPGIDRAALLELFDRQVRREAVAPPRASVEREAETTLFIGDDWSALLWSDLDESNADAVIERVADRLRGLTGHAEWKLYGHDRPADLAERLRAAGFTAEDEEAVMVADAAALPAPGADVRLREDPSAFVDLAAAVFGERHELAANAIAVVAVVDGEAVSGGRVDLDAGTEFAGLYGGVTLPAFRGRGLYRATVLERARLARERGYRWVFVDALPTSRPILERLGFVQLTTTTPYIPG